MKKILFLGVLLSVNINVQAAVDHLTGIFSAQSAARVACVADFCQAILNNELTFDIQKKLLKKLSEVLQNAIKKGDFPLEDAVFCQAMQKLCAKKIRRTVVNKRYIKVEVTQLDESDLRMIQLYRAASLFVQEFLKDCVKDTMCVEIPSGDYLHAVGTESVFVYRDPATSARFRLKYLDNSFGARGDTLVFDNEREFAFEVVPSEYKKNLIDFLKKFHDENGFFFKHEA